MKPETVDWNAPRWSAPSAQLDLPCSDGGMQMGERRLSRKEKKERNALEGCNYLERRQPKTTSPDSVHLSTIAKDLLQPGEREWVGVFKENFTTEHL